MTCICERCGHPLEAPEAKISSSSFALSSAQLRTDLAEIKTAILRQKAYLAALEERNLALIVYRVLELSPELTARIFMACLPSHGRVRPSPASVPLTLAQVCRQWRKIAHTTCKLWSSLDIEFISRRQSGWKVESPDEGEAVEIPNNSAHLLAQAWFPRAKEVPVSLTIRSAHKGIPQRNLELIPSISNHLVRLEPRLSHADFDALREYYPAFPGLRRLAIHVNSRVERYNNHLNFDEHPISIFSPYAPLLVDLSYNAPLHDTSVPILIDRDFPLLTSIELDKIPIRAFLNTIAQLAQLLHVTACFNGGEFYGPYEVKTALQLQSLALRGFCTDSALESLSLPGLSRLRLPIKIQIDALGRFLDRSSCPLQHPALNCDEWEEWDIRALIERLKALPSLTSLAIDFGYTNCINQFIREMESDEFLLPQLSDLIFTTWHDVDLNYNTLIAILRARRHITIHPERLPGFRATSFLRS
ncbi:hypothetical protein B0H11DRAFT_2218061 [Mycena galericulata]|nr:hypothetical protein B0H11DRAFT_2218061 [Mycena galericulata]